MIPLKRIYKRKIDIMMNSLHNERVTMQGYDCKNVTSQFSRSYVRPMNRLEEVVSENQGKVLVGSIMIWGFTALLIAGVLVLAVHNLNIALGVSGGVNSVF